MQNLKLLVGVVVGTLVLVFGVAFLFSGETEEKTYDMELVRGDGRNRLIGRVGGEATESAELLERKVVVVEFSDFQCPACREVEGFVSQLMAKYGDDVSLYYRHFPLEQSHPNAKLAAIASEVVAEKGKFWEYKEVLFENQDEWSGEKDPAELFASYAVDLEIDREDFLEGLRGERAKGLVEEDLRTAVALGVDATPTFFVDGKKVSSVELESAIEEALSK